MDPRDNQFLQHEQSQQRQQERQAAMRRIEQGDRPWKEEVGVMSLVDAVRDLEFPATAEEIASRVGGRNVRTSEGVELPLSYVLPKLQRERFLGVRDFEEAVVRHWRGIETLETPPEQREGRGSQTMPPGADID